MSTGTAAARPTIPRLRDLPAPVRRNLLLLAAGMGALYGMVELASAVATLTFVSAGGPRGLVGLAPAVFLSSAALAALPAGRRMDRHGRVPVLRLGFATGVAGSLTAAAGSFSSSVALVVLGFVLVGASTGTVMLSRAAAADMYPSDRGHQGIALVLFGAVFGAVLGPVVFTPLVASGGHEGSSLGPAWVAASIFMVAGFALASRIRPDPQQIAREIASKPGSAPAAEPEGLRTIVRRPGMPTALLGAVASWAVMVSLMTLIGSALVHDGHGEGAVFPVLGAHFVGMFGLFLLVGPVIDRIGRRRALSAGLALLAACAVALTGTLHSVPLTAVVMFGVGTGWNLAYVAATTGLSEGAGAAERGRLLGFADLLSGLAGAGLTIVAGLVLDAHGIAVVAAGAALVALLAALVITARPVRST